MEYTKEQIKKIVEELTPVDTEDLFEAVFEGNTVKIGGYEYDEARALREIDPTAWRCGVNDYIDGLVGESITDEIDGEHYSIDEVEKLLEDEGK